VVGRKLTVYTATQSPTQRTFSHVGFADVGFPGDEGEGVAEAAPDVFSVRAGHGWRW
jgi:hypothetical protein